MKGNWAPDGIMGPYREKEGSYYTVKQIWSPVQLPDVLPASFGGKLPVDNRYEFTDLSKCGFTWQLRKFGNFAGFKSIAEGIITSPDVAPGKTGSLNLHLPADWKNADALSITARDPHGQELWSWVYPLLPPNKFVPAGSLLVAAATEGDELQLKAGDTEARVKLATGQLLGVKKQADKFSPDERTDSKCEVDDVRFGLAQAELLG